MISLALYIISFVIILVLVGSITVFFGNQANDINMATGASAEYNKFNLYMLDQTKNGCKISRISEEEDKNQFVTFSSGETPNTFVKLKDGNILYFNQMKLCENVDEFKVKKDIADNGKQVLKTYLKINGTVYTTDYVVENNGESIENKDLGYVTDGLILHYDGIQNTKLGHSNSTTVWEDLSESGNHAIFKQTLPNWQEKCYQFSKGSVEYFESKNNLELGTSNRTIEFVVSSSNSELQNIFGMGNLNINEMFDCLIYANGFNSHVFGNLANEGIDEGLIPNKIYSNTWKYQEGKMSYRTNQAKKENVQFQNLNTKSSQFLLGKGLYAHHNNGNSFKVYSIRIYNRVLSEAEIQKNYEKDKIRFGIEE